MLSALYKLEFMERYEGLIPFNKMSLELGTPEYKLKAIKREFSSLCWSCRNACNANNCSWVAAGIYPPFVTIADDGIIAGCLNYERG